MERPFAHQFETGAKRRLRVRGLDEVKKKLLLQAAACNLALLLRTKHGAGTPRGLAEAVKRLCEEILALLGALQAPAGPGNAPIGQLDPPGRPDPAARTHASRSQKRRFRHGLLRVRY